MQSVAPSCKFFNQALQNPDSGVYDAVSVYANDGVLGPESYERLCNWLASRAPGNAIGSKAIW